MMFPLRLVSLKPRGQPEIPSAQRETAEIAFGLRPGVSKFHNLAMTLHDEIENAVKSWEKTLDRRSQEVDDWYQLTQAEEEVFDIESWRWPRMLTAWAFYEDLIDIADQPHFDEVLVKAERKNWPKLRLRVTEEGVFADFAVAKAGLTRKEAHTIFHKVEFWQVRSGLMFGEQKK